MGRKRIRHPGGRSWLLRNENARGEWSVRLEPEGLLVDCFHPGEGAHVHDIRVPARRVALGRVSPEFVERQVTAHLQEHGRISFDQLVRELKPNGD